MSQREHAEVVICGAGIAGIATAYTLAQRGVQQIVLVDERPALSLTSDKSTECYRDFWPGPGNAMVGLMGRSIDILEELARKSNNVFGMNQRGYLYVTRSAAGADTLLASAQAAAALGAGPLRVNMPYGAALRGADYIRDQAVIRQHFPFLADDVCAVLHARRCGWLSAQQLGMYMLAEARALGVRLIPGRLEGVDIQNAAVQAVHVSTSEQSMHITTARFVNCAGPLLAPVGRMLGLELPVFSERHIKLAFEDRLNIVPRHAPMVINADPLLLDWTEEERELLAEDTEMALLLGELPAGAHLRPEGEGSSSWVLALWAYDAAPVPEVFPVPMSEQFPDIVMRGNAAIIPGLQAYVERPPRPILDGGYYTKTRENRPLIGPLPIQGAYVLGALSGYGIMAACGAADLLAQHMLGAALPDYAAAFLPSRYADPAYQELLAHWGDTGQL